MAFIRLFLEEEGAHSLRGAPGPGVRGPVGVQDAREDLTPMRGRAAPSPSTGQSPRGSRPPGSGLEQRGHRSAAATGATGTAARAAAATAVTELGPLGGTDGPFSRENSLAQPQGPSRWDSVPHPRPSPTDPQKHPKGLHGFPRGFGV